MARSGKHCLWFLLGCKKPRVYSRFYFLTRLTGNFISRRERTRASISPPEGPVRGQSGRKIERIQFLSWFADFITPLHTVSYIRSRAPRTFAAAPLGFVIRGVVLLGAPNESGGCWLLARMAHPTKRSLSHDRDRDVERRDGFPVWVRDERTMSERRAMVGSFSSSRGAFSRGSR